MPDHGAPFRLIVPHWYGVASVKWLSRMTSSPSRIGEFQTGHYVFEWPDRAHEPVRSCASARGSPNPPRQVLAPVRHTVRGKAWSGSGPIAGVEVSLSGEGVWYAPTPPPNAPTPGRNGRSLGREDRPPVIRARATDAAGNTHPSAPVESAGIRQQRGRGHYVDVR